jgi:hypothetical protein
VQETLVGAHRAIEALRDVGAEAATFWLFGIALPVVACLLVFAFALAVLVSEVRKRRRSHAA